MLYLTQLIYVTPGREADFLAFEKIALPAMERYGGRLLMRLRPGSSSFIAGELEPPYEVHLVSFEDARGFRQFLEDDARAEALALKEASVRGVLLIEGTVYTG